jgi:quinol-cytochrome oxidoreductase complex cytochrome b subunit
MSKQQTSKQNKEEDSSTCCGVSEASWQRENISDHKFDYVDVDDFLDYSILNRLRYSLIFLFTLKSILVYMADIGILIIMITAARELATILSGDGSDCEFSSFSY